MSKLKQLFCRTIPLPPRLDKILHVRVPRFLSVIIIVLISLPVIELLLSYLIFYILLPAGLFLMDYMSPYPEKITALGIAIVILASYAVILPLYWWFKRCPSAKLIKLALVILLVELIMYFWYTAWRIDYLYHDVLGGFEDFGIENRLDIAIAYIKALFQTVSVTLLLIIPWLFLRNSKKHDS